MLAQLQGVVFVQPDDSLKGTSNNTTPKSTDDNSPCTDPQRKRSQKSTARVDSAQTPTRTGLKHVMSDASIASRLSTEDVPHTAKVRTCSHRTPPPLQAAQAPLAHHVC